MAHLLPPELIDLVISSPGVLDLSDLARLALAHRSFVPAVTTASRRHPLRRILLACLEFVPRNVLSLEAWKNSHRISRADKLWNTFDHDIDAVHIIQAADLFSRFARHLYRVNLGFPAAQQGSLPNSAIGDESEKKAHRLFLFACAVVYAALRGLNRRTQHPLRKDKEKSEYAHLDPAEREAVLLSEFETLRFSLLRCDPFQAHLARSSPESDYDCDCSCACSDRGWACWYLGGWHQLITRYRRFLSPSDVAHLSYRTILCAVPCFPSTSVHPGRPKITTEPVLLSAHVNPDSMLFSLRESHTFSQTKALFNLTEQALAPGMARLWASNIGYAWGEGGSLWHDEQRRSAERRLSRSRSGSGRGEPIEVVLLAHARWRARVFLRQLEGRMNETMMAKARAFDIHFIRRAIQIQQWAGFESPVQVYPSSPFLALERTNKADAEVAGWKAILAPLGKGEIAHTREQALEILGDLHHGLGMGATDLCIETIPPRDDAASSLTNVFFTDASPPGAPDSYQAYGSTRPPLDPLTSIWPPSDNQQLAMQPRPSRYVFISALLALALAFLYTFYSKLL